MPAHVRLLPAAHAKQIIRTALVRANARPDEAFRTPAHIARFAGPHRVVADVTDTLDDLVSDGHAEEDGGLYRLTDAGLVEFRHSPSSRFHGTVN